MVQTQAILIHKDTIAPAWWQLIFSAPELLPHLQPGQFLLLRCSDRFTCYLRRPIFPQPLDNHQLSLLLRPGTDAGFAWLSTRQIGDTLDIIGPLGNGFKLPNTVRNLLLVSDQQLISPLLGQMAQAVIAGLSVTLILGSSRAATLYPAARLPAVVEFYAATLDGSIGHRGSLTNLLPDLVRWADMVCAVGSPELYQVLKATTASVRLIPQAGFSYGLMVDHQLVCGVGACSGCTIETTDGLKLICTDGPVFDLLEIDPGTAANG